MTWKSHMQSSVLHQLHRLLSGHQEQLVPCILLTVQVLRPARVTLLVVIADLYNCYISTVTFAMYLWLHQSPAVLTVLSLMCVPSDCPAAAAAAVLRGRLFSLLLGNWQLAIWHACMENGTIHQNWKQCSPWLCLGQTALVGLLGQSRWANGDVTPYVIPVTVM